ncbi:hypothetical protein [Streptomyces djakartensis]|uniref:Membrane-bound hydrophilic protein n=1 Tax=Streptomyces djakartensis TaxID=68193 RepID=A0ABQ3AEW4_9ACTN|nr:hypothetical protein [Streptomyces djakartensis]GGY48287.1 hypothetical protein GCM10010384_63270 [Streptomyces djakartensis]
MPADEVTRGADAEASRVRTGPRHAAPKKPLFTRFQMPAGKAIAMAAMPTAVLMGMGFTPTLALADDQPSTSNSLKADEYKDCVAALEGDKGKDDASPSPSPSGSETDGEKDEATAEPTPSASAGGSDEDKDPAGSGSSDSGSDDQDDKTQPTPAPSASSDTSGEDEAATPSPSPSESGGNVLEDIGDAIGGILTGGKSTESPSPTPSASTSPSGDTGESEATEKPSVTDDASDTVKETTDKVTDTARDTVKDTTDTASRAAEGTTGAAEKAVEEAADKATASPSPSESPSVDPEDCPAATDAEGGIDNKILVPDDPWYLEASSLKLHGADYQGIVEVKTASGATKKVLKFVISDGTEIGDLHQLVKDKQSGKTHHVQAAKGSTSTITDGKTVMYTEKISGNLLGLVPLTFDPEHPPPLNLAEIYFTKVKVTQAGQFGGTLTVPGLHQYVTD